MNENPLQPSDIGNLEIEMEKHEAQELTLYRKCHILCGRESIAVSVLVLVLGGSNIFIFFAYTGGFKREGMWVFFALAILSFLLVLSFTARSCIAIQPKKLKKKGDEKEQENREEDKKPSTMCVIVKTHYNYLFDINGKYYFSR